MNHPHHQGDDIWVLPKHHNQNLVNKYDIAGHILTLLDSELMI
jgi:hypothetical protein